MSFKFHCPHCNQKIEAEEEWIGQEIECPECRKIITINKESVLQIINPPPIEQEQLNVAQDVESSTNTDNMGNDSKLNDIYQKIRNLFSVQSIKKLANKQRIKILVNNQIIRQLANNQIIKKLADNQSIKNFVNNQIIRQLANNLILFLGAIGIAFLFVLYLKHYPRIAFWTLAPILGLIVFKWHEKVHKFLLMIIYMGIIFWGWEVHHLNVSSYPIQSQISSFSQEESDSNTSSSTSSNVENDSNTSQNNQKTKSSDKSTRIKMLELLQEQKRKKGEQWTENDYWAHRVMYLSDYILCGDYSDEPGTPDEINERLQEVFGGTILEEAIKKVGGEKFLSNLIDSEKAERRVHDEIGDDIHLLSPEQQKIIKMNESFMATVRRKVLEKHLK